MSATLDLFPDMVGTSEDRELIEAGRASDNRLARELAERLELAAERPEYDDLRELVASAERLLSWIEDSAPDSWALDDRVLTRTEDLASMCDVANGWLKHGARG